MGSFEWTREAARRPYVIRGVMYSNGVLEKELPGVSRRGILSSARFAKIREIPDESLLEAGEEIFKLHCYACHTIRGINNDIAAREAFEANCTICHDADLVQTRTAGWGREKIRKALDHLSALDPAMPDFGGSPAEKDRIADHIVSLGRGSAGPAGSRNGGAR